MKSGVLAAAAAGFPVEGLGASESVVPQKISSDIAGQGTKDEPFDVRIAITSLNNPFYESKDATGTKERDAAYWANDRQWWDNFLTQTQANGYNAVVYYPNPWMETQWPSFMIRNRDYPEARDVSPDQAEQMIEHVTWIFAKAKERGIKNFLFNMCVYTPMAFARAHGYDKEMTPSPTVSGYHNHLGHSWGVRSELTRNYSIAAITELLETYPDLDGMMGTMGESMPGKRSTWYKEAIVPALKRSGRRPVYIVYNWLMPMEDFLEDIAPKEVYDNTWLAISHNGEMISDVKPYPTCVSWAERTGLPTVIQIIPHNLDRDWYWGNGFGSHNSPRLAAEILSEFRKVDNCIGFKYMDVVTGHNRSYLFAKALGYYGGRDEPYSDEPWIKLLEERFGDRAAAEHLLKALDVSSRICPEMGALAWCPHDLYTQTRLSLPYSFFDLGDFQWGTFTSASREGGLMLLPVRFYAQEVARLGDTYRDNNGGDWNKPPYHQILIWGHIDYPVTPEAHMRKIRAMGEACLREAEEGRDKATKDLETAEYIYHQMKANKLLTDFYEKKVLAAISALIFSFKHDPKEKEQAVRLADETVQLYITAIDFIRENIEKEPGGIRSSWANKNLTLTELIEVEKKERDQMPVAFKWPVS